MPLEKIINKIIELGLDLGTKDAVKAAMEIIDADTELVDDVYFELKNRLNVKALTKIPYEQRALFLPQCLRHSSDCQATLTDTGFDCKRCGSCVIPKIKEEAEKLGYKVYIVPGASMVFNIVKQTRPRACIGVGCVPELEEAVARLSRAGMIGVGVPLLKDGCKDTEVDVKAVIKSIKIEYVA